MKILLDSLVVVWLLQDSHELGVQSRRLIQDAEGVWVSPMSLAEIGAKAVSGGVTLAAEILPAIRETGVSELVVTWEDAALVGQQMKRGDDLTNMLLITQCIRADMMLLTADVGLIKAWPELTINARN